MALQHIQGNLDSINYDAKVGIITFNTSVTYYSIPEDLSEENIKRVSCIDTENPFCALSEGDLYLSLAEEREKIDFLINHLIQQAEKMSFCQGSTYEYGDSDRIDSSIYAVFRRKGYHNGYQPAPGSKMYD
jgi:hypothetical protein